MHFADHKMFISDKIINIFSHYRDESFYITQDEDEAKIASVVFLQIDWKTDENEV